MVRNSTITTYITKSEYAKAKRKESKKKEQSFEKIALIYLDFRLFLRSERFMNSFPLRALWAV